MAGERLHIFGIRHHGPGSAHSLVQALDELAPAAVLIEGPPEANGLIQFAASPQMRPPLALLIYGADDPSYSSFDPFAEYSPEWQAMQWAIARKCPVRFIDLPASHTLAARKAAADAAKEAAAEREDEADSEEVEEEEELVPEAFGEPAAAEAADVRSDPLAYLAELAGYEDSETWWNALIEQGAHAPDIFASIESAMTALREALDAEPPRHPARKKREQQREAHMRLAIADALKETDGPVAAVCGAWHVPALRRKVPKALDKALLKDLPKLKVSATWAPWTNTRLTIASGYGAGISSPGWYGHLWGELRRWREGGLSPRAFTAHWQTRVAALLRKSGRITATASVIEAARLAETLAALRELPLPGLPEMRDASLAALCEGETLPLRLIEDRLVSRRRCGRGGPGRAANAAAGRPHAPAEAAEAQARGARGRVVAGFAHGCGAGEIVAAAPAQSHQSWLGQAHRSGRQPGHVPRALELALGPGILRAPCRGYRPRPDHRGGRQQRGCVAGEGSGRSRRTLDHRAGLPFGGPRRRGAGGDSLVASQGGGHGRYRRTGRGGPAAGDDPALRRGPRNAGGRAAPPGHEPDRSRLRWARLWLPQYRPRGGGGTACEARGVQPRPAAARR